MAQFPTLDGWRTVAVLVVIWGHLMPGLFFPRRVLSGQPVTLRRIRRRCLFGIGGLLITFLLLDERSRFGRVSIPAFSKRRAFRILPPCFVYLGIALCIGLIRSPLELISCVFFFRNYLPDAMGTNITMHLWSLAVEEHLYLLWPAALVFIVLRRCRPPSGLPVALAAIDCGLLRIADAQNHFTATSRKVRF